MRASQFDERGAHALAQNERRLSSLRQVVGERALFFVQLLENSARVAVDSRVAFRQQEFDVCVDARGALTQLFVNLGNALDKILSRAYS